MLDWKKLGVFDVSTHASAILGKNESLTEVVKGRELLNKMFKTDITKLNNAKFSKMVKDRFGTMTSFYEMLEDIEQFSDDPTNDTPDDFNATRY